MKGTDRANRRLEAEALPDNLVTLTTRDVGEALRLSRVGVWRLVRKEDAGFPKAIVLGRRQKRWIKSEVEAWLQSLPRSAT